LNDGRGGSAAERAKLYPFGELVLDHQSPDVSRRRAKWSDMIGDNLLPRSLYGYGVEQSGWSLLVTFVGEAITHAGTQSTQQ